MIPKKARDALDSLKDSAQYLDSLWRNIIDVDRPQVIGYVVELRKRHPDLSEEQLIDKLYDASRLNALALGFVSGLPGGLAAVPANLAEFYAMAKIECLLIGCVAFLRRSPAFDSPNLGMHIAVVLAGEDALSQIAKRPAGFEKAGEVQGAWRMMNGYLVPSRMELVKNIVKGVVKNRLLIRLTSRSLPLLGGVIGAAFNWRELRIILKNARLYFTP